MFSFLPHKQSHPCTHWKTISYPSVDSTPVVLHLLLSGFFLTSLHLYISSSLHLPSPPSIVLSLSLSFTLSSLFFHPCSLFLSLSSHINPSSLITVDVELNVEMRYMQQGGKLTPFKARPSVPSLTLSGTASHLYPVWLIITVTLQRERYVKWARGIFKRFNLEYHSSSVPNKCQREYHYGGLVNQDIERRRMNQRGAAKFNSEDNLCPILLISYLYPGGVCWILGNMHIWKKSLGQITFIFVDKLQNRLIKM